MLSHFINSCQKKRFGALSSPIFGEGQAQFTKGDVAARKNGPGLQDKKQCPNAPKAGILVKISTKGIVFTHICSDNGQVTRGYPSDFSFCFEHFGLNFQCAPDVGGRWAGRAHGDLF